LICKIYHEEVLFSYTLGELNQEEENRLRNHLEDCSICLSKVEEYFSLQETWEHPDPNSYTISESFVDNIMNEISTDDSLLERSNVVDIKKLNKSGKSTGKKNAFLHFALATAATFVLLYSGIFDQMYQSVGQFTTTFSETTNQVQQASVQGVSWLHVNFNFSQIMHNIKF